MADRKVIDVSSPDTSGLVPKFADSYILKYKTLVRADGRKGQYARRNRTEIMGRGVTRQLKSDHVEIRRREWILKMLVYHGDYSFALRCAEDLRRYLGQHFLKKEYRLLFVLASRESKGSSSSDAKDLKASLEVLPQRHKEMKNSFQEILEITALSLEGDKLKAFDNFERQFLGLLQEEEEATGERSALERVPAFARVYLCRKSLVVNTYYN
jgi:hypothetical protein